MLLLPTPVQQKAHRNSPELCRAYADKKVTTLWSTMSFTKTDSVGDSLNLKNFPYPLFSHKHSDTSSAWPVELVLGVLALDCATVATMVSGLLNAADIHFPAGLCFHYLANSAGCSHWVFPPWISSGDSPQWPDPASHTWQEAKPETLPAERCCLLAPPNCVPILLLAMQDFGTTHNSSVIVG